MLIFFRNIHKNTRQSDLMGFIQPAMKRGWFSRKGHIESVKVIEQHDGRTKISEFHGLVMIRPDAAAKQVIKRLNRLSLLGKHIVVREFHIRDWHNDQRLKYRPSNSGLLNRRIGDRRRKSLEVIKENVHEFSALDAFRKQY